MVDPHDHDAARRPGDSQAKSRPGSASTGGGSRANSFDHGLRAKIVFSDEMAQAILERTQMLGDQFLPEGEYEDSLIHDMAVARVKLDRAADLLVANADRVVSRARDFWDFDRRERALKLLRRLPKNPAYLAHKLAGTKQGALLMVERWEGLGQLALAAGDWNEAQRQLALDLLGTALELRSSTTALPPAGDRDGLAALATREVARLRTAIDQVLGPQDAQDRADTIAGFRLADDDETRCLRRYEAMAQRDYNRAHADLLRAQELADLYGRDDTDDRSTASFSSMVDLLRSGAKRLKPHLERVAEGMKARREAREAAAAAAAQTGTGTGDGPAAAGPAASTSPPDPPPATDEPITIGQGKSTPAREHRRQLRKAAQEQAAQPARKGA
jgi:hypothetical protein